MRLMNYPKLLAAVVLPALFLHSCAVIVAKGHQNVTVESATPGTVIKYANDSVGMDKVKLRVSKRKIEEVTAEKDGYKTGRYDFETHKLNPYYAFSIIDIWFLGPLAELGAPKLHNFDKHQTIPALVPFEKRTEKEKFLFVESTSIDTKGADLNYITYRSIKKFRKNADTHTPRKGTVKDDLKMDNTIFSDELNTTLKKMNFIDTTQTVFPNTGNCLLINSTIRKMNLHNINRGNRAICMELEIDWDIMDFYKQKILTITTHKKSDLFVVDPRADVNTGKLYDLKVAEAIRDNLEYALIDVRKELKEKGLLEMTTGRQDTFATMYLKKPVYAPNRRMNEFLKSTVSIKVDEGHGSGIVASEDGLIITNYHVIAGTKNIEVIFNDGSKAKAEIVRKNANADLALLKVHRDSLRPLEISESNDPEIGIDVWAIGTPKSLELGQSVSKGIISGIRMANDMTYIQTDAKVSPGNSGGALITREGVVLGIVSSKLIALGTEGIGFAILGSDIFSRLKLKYK